MQGNIFICLLLYSVCAAAKSGRSFEDQCGTCKTIVKNFEEGLEKTARSNFGGGNTKWEESRLGKFATSETRLVEIMDDFICKDSNKECSHMLEEAEEYIEDYWFTVLGKGKDYDLKRFLCIGRLKVCCPENTYGAECEPCPGVDNRCSGRGTCGGEGTRGGSGTCLCSAGYSGTLCDSCAPRYYEASRTDTSVDCLGCDESCESTCTIGGPRGCDQCKSGYNMSEDGCQDIDECKNEASSCSTNEYCKNTQGSFSCLPCSRGCDACFDQGQDKCTACYNGYRLSETTCEDINECEENLHNCGEGEVCVNDEGGHDCRASSASEETVHQTEEEATKQTQDEASTDEKSTSSIAEEASHGEL